MKFTSGFLKTIENPKNQYQIKQSMKRNSPRFFAGLFRYAFLIGMSYVLLYPILIMVTRSLRPAADMLNPSIIWISSGITLDNIIKAAQILDFGNTALFTARIVIISTIFTLVSCSLAGYALARFNLKLTPILTGLVIFTIIVPMQTYIIPLYFQFRFFDFFGLGSFIGLFVGHTLSVNLTDTELTFYITSILGAGLRSGLFILVFMNFFRGMPKELEDAARIDGCGEARTYMQVMLPNASSVFLVVFLFSVVWYWNDYFFSQIMLRSQQMLSNKIGMLRDLVNMNLNVVSSGNGFTETVVIYAGALLFVLPPLLLYLVAQKYFTQSIDRTGIVG